VEKLWILVLSFILFFFEHIFQNILILPIYIDYISHLTQLSELQLCDFKLSEDKFPDWMWTFTRLTTFLTQEFDIGPLPVPMGVTNLVHLNNWEIGCMKFTGEFPMEICKMEKFVQLRIQDTEITSSTFSFQHDFYRSFVVIYCRC